MKKPASADPTRRTSTTSSSRHRTKPSSPPPKPADRQSPSPSPAPSSSASASSRSSSSSSSSSSRHHRSSSLHAPSRSPADKSASGSRFQYYQPAAAAPAADPAASQYLYHAPPPPHPGLYTNPHSYYGGPMPPPYPPRSMAPVYYPQAHGPAPPMYPHAPPHHHHHHQPPQQSPQPQSPGSSYEQPMFLYPQSSVFASYLQLVPPTSSSPAPKAVSRQGYRAHKNKPEHQTPPANPQDYYYHHHPQYIGYPPPPPPPHPASILSIPRGPPKKPKKSGFALWVGNLPQSTSLLELCALFGTDDIQSIFLIQRTLCAFVNYNSERALHEGKRLFETRGKALRGNLLVVKIKNSTDLEDDYSDLYYQGEDRAASASGTPRAPAATDPTTTTPGKVTKDRYFVCKSLTVEDLHASATYGIWATQSHNQALFNEAFKTCDNVYLIFSANRAGEYFGYARMASKISQTLDRKLLSLKDWDWSRETGLQPPRAQREQQQQQQREQQQQQQQQQYESLADQFAALEYSSYMPNIPRVYPTAANRSIPIPAGRIVDDSSRGTLFWEVVAEDEPPSSGDSSTQPPPKHPSGPSKSKDKASTGSSSRRASSATTPPPPSEASADLESSSNNWTVPFRIEWLSTPGKTVPFYMVRHLHNPYNRNQPVKIARDGTEIEPSVGRQIVTMFHQK